MDHDGWGHELEECAVIFIPDIKRYKSSYSLTPNTDIYGNPKSRHPELAQPPIYLLPPNRFGS